MNCAKTRKGRSLHNGGCDQSLIRKYILMNGNGWAYRLFLGAPAEIRTPDTLLKRQVLCLLSYWGMSLIFGWDGGTRTHYIRVKV